MGELAVLGVQTSKSSKGVTLEWSVPAIAWLVEIRRRPGVLGQSESVLYRGRGSRYVDALAQSNVEMHYALVGYDRRGNRSPKVSTFIKP